MNKVSDTNIACPNCETVLRIRDTMGTNSCDETTFLCPICGYVEDMTGEIIHKGKKLTKFQLEETLKKYLGWARKYNR